MRLTPGQLEQVQQAKERGGQHVSVQFTPEQRNAWREALAQELAGKEGNLARFQKIKAAAEQPGLFGDVRRTMLLSRRPVNELAAALGVDAQLLSDFRAGEAELSAAVLDRLVDALGLRLMQEIPR